MVVQGVGLTVGVRHGDTPASERRRQALHPPHLLITTPETLQAIFMGKRLRKHLTCVRHVIVDEIHELAGSKRGAQLSVALERLAMYAGEFQRIGLSATVGNPGDVAAFLCGDRPCQVVEIPVTPHLEIHVRYAGEDFADQARYVGRCISRKGSSLVFVNTRVTAEALGHQLYETGDVEVHHGSLSKEVRVDAEERFKRGDIHALICTSSMELGIRHRPGRACHPVWIPPGSRTTGPAGRACRPPAPHHLPGHHPHHRLRRHSRVHGHRTDGKGEPGRTGGPPRWRGRYPGKPGRGHGR